MERNERKMTFFKVIMAFVIIILIILAVLIAMYIKSNGDNASNNSKDTAKENRTPDIVVANNTTGNITGTENEAFTWEDYPDNMIKIVSKWLFDDETVMQDEEEQTEDSVWLDLKLKMLYSLSKNYPSEKNVFLDDIGDGTKVVETNSNYAKYNADAETISEEDKNAKYSVPIEFNLAVFNEETWASDGTLEQKAKNQYTTLKGTENGYTFTVGKLYIMNGKNNSKEEYLKNSRAKKLKVTINNEKEYEISVADTNQVQVFDINYTQSSIETPVNIKVEVVETYQGDSPEGIYISDMQFTIDSNIPQGR